MQYTDLIFDLYGTLVDISTDEDETTWQNTAMFFGFHGARYSADELRDAFYDILNRLEAKSGQAYEGFPEIKFEDIFKELFIRKGVRHNADMLSLNAAHLFRISSLRHLSLYHWVIPSLEKLKAKGYRLWLLSNAQRSFTEYELNYLNLTDKFDGIYLSSDFGCKKPDSKFFSILTDTEKLDVKHCLMIGNDKTTDIAGAQAMGMATLFIHSNLTPHEQTACASASSFEHAAKDCRHFEYTGTMDWGHIAYLIYHDIDTN